STCTIDTVQVPGSKNRGNVIVPCQVPFRLVPEIRVVAYPACVELLEGPTKYTAAWLAPEKSSVMPAVSVTSAEPLVTSMDIGLKAKLVSIGGVVSVTDVTWRVVGKPM